MTERGKRMRKTDLVVGQKSKILTEAGKKLSVGKGMYRCRCSFKADYGHALNEVIPAFKWLCVAGGWPVPSC
jgi:hypothetical protein